MMETIRAVDMFAGAGGTSTGLIAAATSTGQKVDLTAINHWPAAISTHEMNHPWARHICANVEQVDPREVAPGGHLDILVASPECTHFSCAAGGRPKLDQKRASAWIIPRWLELLDVSSLLVENVPEFRSWGPLNSRGTAIRKLEGETFRAWTSAIRSLGYNLDYRVLNAADYGDATSRRRLFILARKGRRAITWPEPTYARAAVHGRKKWRAAREIIDWSIQGQSIFRRERPLSPRTMKRIVAGLKKFSGPELRPFLVLMENGGGIRDVEEPLPTITTARGGSMGVAQPFLIQMEHSSRLKSVEEPLPVVSSKQSCFGLVEPFILSQGSGGSPRSVDDSVPTIPAAGAHALVEPFLLPYFGEREGQELRIRSIDEPLPTVAARGHQHLVQPFLVGMRGTDGSSSIERPLSTVTGGNHHYLAEPCLIQYYGSGTASDVNDPLPVVTTKDRFGLVQPVVNGTALDIRFRMLRPHELSAAMGFPESYQFTGSKTDQVRQIGNAVAVNMAKSLCLSLIGKKQVAALEVVQ